MDTCVQSSENMSSYEFFSSESLDVKSMPCKTDSTFLVTATKNADLIALLKSKPLYFTHRATLQSPSRKAAEHYRVLSIILIHQD
jgi:hypothetical protein